MGNGDWEEGGTRGGEDKGSQRCAEASSVEEPVRCGGSPRCSTWRASGVDKEDKGEFAPPITNYPLPFGFASCFKSGDPTAGARLPGNPSSALPPQRTGSPITNYLLPNSQFPITIYPQSPFNNLKLLRVFYLV
ncbi:hypothetical protein [Tolypothrix sp. VBCCA 56010]|uniref:hypothetical protein n=1 Tax=Tolypothrix sp. VBCCA 56010 TaxID=3137731 RepID=UPI003D7D64A8